MELRINIQPQELPNLTAMGIRSIAEPWRYPDRVLTINIMLFVLEGALFITENNIDYTIHKHQVFFLKNHLHHYGSQLTQSGARWCWISFLPTNTSTNSETIYLPKQLDVMNPPKMIELITLMDQLYGSNQPFKAQRLSGYLYQLFFTLLSQPPNSDRGSKILVAPKIIQILQSQLDKSFSSKEISDRLDMNYSYLGKLFKSETGTTINHYYMELKVNEVIKLLKTTNLNLSEISDKLNYANPYYLSKCFKKVTGMSPRDYKNHLY